MGLDMFVKKTKEKLEPEVDFNCKYEETEELFYWRKHPNMHGWMKQLYEDKGGVSQNDFNGDLVKLTMEDLIQLEYDIKNKNLPKTSGFFFGESRDENLEIDLNFIKLAKEAINEQYNIFYISSW